ncbi:MAG TPA: sulfatase [Candidatus Binatia bacterium]
MLSHLAVWLAVPCAEWFVSRGLHPSPAPWQWTLEGGAFAALGLAQWRLAESLWLRTLLWPSLLVVLSGLTVAGPTAPLNWQFFYLAGLVLLVTSTLRDFGARLQVPVIVAFVVAFAAPVANRALDLDTLEGQISAGFGGIEGSSGELSFELAGAPSAPPKSGPGGPPIVVISIDTLRADAATTMQAWKRLTAMGAWWPTTLSSSSWTLPASASMQSGKTVTAHGADCVVGGSCQGMFPSVRTIAQELEDRGYLTAAFTANPWITRSTGFSRGFQTFRDLAGVPPFRLTLAGPPAGLPSQDSVVVVDQAIQWLQGTGDRPFYLWVHLLGPHMPYSHSPDPGLQTITGDQLRSGGATSPEFRAAVRKAYDDEVVYTDREVLRLLDALQAKGVFDRGIVVMTADHGEEFWEHGGIEHGHTHHREVTEIPLVIVGSGFAPGARPGVASLIDLAPTLEAVAGAPAGGFDLRQPIAPDRIATSFGNLYGGTMRSARDMAEHVIGSRLGIDSERWDRYELGRDPGEQAPLASDPNDRVQHEAASIEPPASGQKAGVNREALKSLGYAN